MHTLCHAGMACSWLPAVRQLNGGLPYISVVSCRLVHVSVLEFLALLGTTVAPLLCSTEQAMGSAALLKHQQLSLSASGS